MNKKYLITLVLIGFIIYFIGLQNSFVWDDEEQIVNNSIVHSIENIPSLFLGSTFNTGGSGSLVGLYYKPLMSTCFAILYSLFGLNPLPFHLFQIMIHIASSLILFLIFKTFFKDKIAFILSLLFLVHPINVESAVYSSALQDSLFLFFGLLTVFLITQSSQNTKYFLLSPLFLFLSLLSKETGLVFIPITFSYIFFFKKKELLKIFLLQVFVLITYFILRFIIAGVYFQTTPLFPISRASFAERIITIPKIIIHYLQTFIYPANLSISEHWVVKQINFPDFLLPFLALLVILSLSTLFFSRLSSKFRSPFLFFLSWFIFGLSFHLQIFPLDMTVADRWFYLPQIGLLGIIGIATMFISTKVNLIEKTTPSIIPESIRMYSIRNSLIIRNSIFLILVSIIVLLSFRSFIRIQNWQNGLTLFIHDEKINQGAFDLENNVGTELFRAGKLEEAKIHFEKSTILAPYWWTNWNNLGVYYQRKGETNKAKDFYQKAIDNGNYYLAFENLAAIKFNTEDPNETIKFLEESLKKLPQNPKLWLILSLTEYRLGNKDNALKAASNSYQIQPSNDAAFIINRLQKNLPLEVETKK